MTRSPVAPARFLKTHHLLVAVIVVLLAVASVTGFVWAKKSSVTLVVDGDMSRLKTETVDVAALLEQAGVSVSDGDIVNPPLDSPIEDGMTVTVRHATHVTLLLSGDSLDLTVIGSTVADVLVFVGLDPESGLSVNPPIGTPLEPGMTITTTDMFLRVVQEEVEIPFETETVNDPDLFVGTREVRTEGVAGRMLRIWEVVVIDGSEGGRVLKAERVVERPVSEVIVVGTRRARRQILVSRGSVREIPSAPESGRRLSVIASAYTPGVGCGYTTATGAKAGYGIVAVDPSVIPLGTKLYIPGYGYGVAADTGGSIKGDRIDLCFDSLSEALAWGRRTVTIIIVE